MKASLFVGEDDCDLFHEQFPTKFSEEVSSPSRLLLGKSQARLSG